MKPSPYDSKVESQDRNQTTKNLERLGDISLGSDFSFSLHTDTHFYIKNFQNTLPHINSHEVNFNIGIGDFSEQGLKYEYEKYLQQIKSLTSPTFVAIGNHDSVAYGKELYLQMFGEDNFSFIYAGVKFIFFNANNWEWGSVNFNWLESEVTSYAGEKIVISHIPLRDEERFSKEELSRFSSIIDGKVLAVFFGHLHSYSDILVNGTLHYGMTQTKDKEYDIIKKRGGQYEIHRCQGDACAFYLSF